MSVLSDEQLMDIARPACGNFRWPSTALDIMRAAITADRAARAEPVGGMVLVSSGALSMVMNALQRDADEGKVARGEMLAELRKTVSATPAAPVVPGTITPKDAPDLCDDEDMRNAYADGWNNCRHAMFATVPAPSQDKGGTA